MPYAEIDEHGRIEVKTSYADRYLIRQLPGAGYDGDRQTWHAPLSWSACVTLRGLFGWDLEVGPQLEEWARAEHSQRIAPALLLRDKLAFDQESLARPGIAAVATLLNEIEREAPGDRKLFPYQRIDVVYLALVRDGILANPMGLGKSASVIRTLQVLQCMVGDHPFPVLVICPNTVKETWAGELRKFAPHLTYSVVTGSASQRRKAIEAGADVTIVNWEALRIHSRLAGYGSMALTDAEKAPKELNKAGFKTVIADEAHHCVPYNTEVLTPHGPRLISSIREGDLVLGTDHKTGEQVWSAVSSVMKSSLRPVISIGPLHITPEHPVWVSHQGSLCYANQYAVQAKAAHLRVVRDSVHDDQAPAEILLEELRFERDVLVAAVVARDVLRENEEAHARAKAAGEACSAPGRAWKPVPRSRSASTSAYNDGCKRVAEPDGRQRDGSYRPAAGAAQLTEIAAVGLRIPGKRVGEASRLPDLLQNRHSVPGEENRDRSSRQRAWQATRPRELRRPEKERISAEPGMGYRMGMEPGNPGGSLWNLETATGNYFADGILVSNCKDPHSKQARAMWALARDAEYRYLMTGTPVVSNVGDLWSLLHAVDPQGFPAKTKYLDRWARVELSFYGGAEILGLKPETAEEFRKVTDYLIRRVPKEAALPQLPEKLPVTYRFTEMSPVQARLYREMERNEIALIEAAPEGAEILSAPNAIAQLTRLLQFASASATQEETGRKQCTQCRKHYKAELEACPACEAAGWQPHLQVRLQMPSSKVEDLVELLSEMGEDSLVVAAVHTQLLNLAAARLERAGISYGLITGEQDTAARQEAITAFQDGKLRVMLLNIAAGGEGITLTRASTLLFMQRHWSKVLNDQVEDRLHRIGQHSPVQVIDQITPGTAEYRKLQVIGEKADRIEEIIRDRETLLKLLGV